jgi:hypothetical protein
MRVSQKPNRSRGRSNRKPSNGNNVNRVFESSGPEGKVRGTPQQIIEKYLSLARDSQTSGHRVVAENFLQHAEHYQRLLNEAMVERQERQENQQPGQQPSLERPNTNQPNIHEAEAGNERIAAPEAGSGQQPREGDNRPNNRSNNRSEGRSEGQGESRGESRRKDHDPRESDVSGLTMIDSGNGDSGSLLVDVEELGSSQPRRPRRRRDQEPAEAPATVEVDAPQSE